MTLPPLSSTRDLRADGYSANEIARLRRSGRLTRLRRGVYVREGTAAVVPEDRHRRLIEATVPYLSAGAVVSHASAAVLHGLPVWSDQLDRVQLTRPRQGGGKRRGCLHLHAAPLAGDEVEVRDGIVVTSLARTVVDLARYLPFEQAVAAADAALRARLDPVALQEALARARRRPGIAAARRVAGFADGRSESAGESLSRVVLHRLRLPAPQLQHEVRDRTGLLVGRTDFCWPEHRTVGEFDGRLKYGRLRRAGEAAEDAVYREKRREDALRDAGWEVVRWSWADLREPEAVRDRLLRAFRRGSRAPRPIVAPLPPTPPPL